MDTFQDFVQNTLKGYIEVNPAKNGDGFIAALTDANASFSLRENDFRVIWPEGRGTTEEIAVEELAKRVRGEKIHKLWCNDDEEFFQAPNEFRQD